MKVCPWRRTKLAFTKGQKGSDNANVYFDDIALIASNLRAVVKTNTTDNLLSVIKKNLLLDSPSKN